MLKECMLTESQYRQLTEENLREFLYSFWDNQKRQGEDPSLDDIIFQLTDIRKDSISDYNTIRPLWYEYNGGIDVLAKKVYAEIINKTFIFKRLYDFYLSLPQEVVQNVVQVENLVNPPAKRGRPKKHGGALMAAGY